MSTFIYHNGQLQYSHKEFIANPKPSQFGYQGSGLYEESGWLIEGGEEAYLDAIQKEKDFYASLLPVVNPEAIIHDAFDEHICRGDSENPIMVIEGDHWDVPDGVEVTEETLIDETMKFYPAVRLSIKAK